MRGDIQIADNRTLWLWRDFSRGLKATAWLKDAQCIAPLPVRARFRPCCQPHALVVARFFALPESNGVAERRAMHCAAAGTCEVSILLPAARFGSGAIFCAA